MEKTQAERFTQSGFLINSEIWDEEIGAHIARREGLLEMTPTHWQIIRYLREYYAKFDFVPPLSRACKVSGERWKSCLSCFFQSDPLKAVKIAGLPEPGGEVKTYYRGICRCDQPSPPLMQTYRETGKPSAKP
jgi:TusE/DsrC/DsvC family sulfur relay protein